MARVQHILWSLLLLASLMLAVFAGPPFMRFLGVLILFGLQLVYTSYLLPEMKWSNIRSLAGAFITTVILFSMDHETHGISDFFNPGNVLAALMYTAGIFCLFSACSILARMAGKGRAIYSPQRNRE